MGRVGSLGDASVFGVLFVDGLSSGDVVDELKEQQNHSNDGQDERHIVQRLVAQSIFRGDLSTSTIGEGDGTAGSVMNISHLVDSSGDTQTEDEDEDDVEEEGVLSLGGQEKFQGNPNDHQTSAGQEKTSSSSGPAASDNSFQTGGIGNCVKLFTRDGAELLAVNEGDLLAGNVTVALCCAIIAVVGVVVDFTVLVTELIVAGVLGCGTCENEQDDSDNEEEESERLSAGETHER